ncbi:polysulfide reductase NrfD [Luteipulveratus sp. YIM 133132]|uniref:NrfD/PsrC family molybdoenzyme membrane anchor subunit n=1 Tax=Luteipulveratus flavus TaxID=3031728 RepID=UPI0023AFDB82|nr:NrfD/PsrC family molybdoenzyme membrane anchor subunit [Luteipulveratus sp. YIM 133132]MDE9365705.1 polysulfide reductase NrfD [Luteipulveratus sp. YIM 133132]
MSPRREPEPEFASYYGRPILKEPTWEARDIAGYLFAGGLAGASSAIAAAAQLTGRPALARVSRIGAVGGLGFSVVALVHDLGRPARFVNMLRVAKPTSPMSVGSWLLAGYGPLAGAALASDLTGIARPAGYAAGVGAGVLGAGVATYTSALFADTAVPAWHETRHELPFLFAGSAVCAASGFALIGSPTAQVAPLRTLAVGGAALELSMSARMPRSAGLAGETFGLGRAGALMRSARVATAVGAVGAGVLGGRSRAVAAASGLALLAGSALTRFGIFEAGRLSTQDPKYVVVPQRERLAQQEREAATVG